MYIHGDYCTSTTCTLCDLPFTFTGNGTRSTFEAVLWKRRLVPGRLKRKRESVICAGNSGVRSKMPLELSSAVLLFK